MRKIIIILFLTVLTCNFSHAQENRKPVTGTKAFSFGITGTNPFALAGASQTGNLLFRYYLTDDISLRLGVALNRSSVSMEENNLTTGPNAGRRIETSSSESLLLFSLGAQKSLGESERVEPYLAADIIIGRGSSRSRERNEIVNPVLAGGTAGDYTETETTDQPVTVIGLIPAVGFNYFFLPGLALGAEFAWGMTRAAIGEGSFTMRSRTGGADDPTITGVTGTERVTQFGSFGLGRIVFTVAF